MASPRQRRKVKRVMREYKRGQLKSGRGRRGKVKSRRQAIAIAMSESRQSRNKRSGKASRRRAGTRRKTTRSSSARGHRKSSTRRRRTG